MIAALQMYDLPELRAETDALWAAFAEALRARGVAAPDRLARPEAVDGPWTRPDLLLAQTCGWPYVTRLRGRVRLVATPCHAAEGCDGPRYRSIIVARADDPAPDLAAMRGRRLAYNAPDSQSGVQALRAAVAPLAEGRPFFAETVRTGAHRASMAAVAAGHADVAAIDCVTWALLDRIAPRETAGLRALGWTPAAPGLPLISAAEGARLAAIGDATLHVLRAPETAALRAPLLIAGAAAPEDAAYDRLTALAAEADALGCPALA